MRCKTCNRKISRHAWEMRATQESIFSESPERHEQRARLLPVDSGTFCSAKCLGVYCLDYSQRKKAKGMTVTQDVLSNLSDETKEELAREFEQPENA